MKVNDRLIRIMIEKIAHNQFITYTSTKLNLEDIYTPFTPLFSQNSAKIFQTSEEALKYTSDKYRTNIICVQNEISDLLTIEEIKNITGCDIINEM
ncbi:hypothetical protein CRU99_11565 [Malaciobacter mytili]|nr:hypothetical protein CRU99_11565 [Malaciobacter mytili]